MPQTLGDRIRAARLRYGMSQAELARRLDVSPTTMNSIEAGRTLDPGVLKVKEIARILRVNMNYLVGFTDNMESEYEAAALDLVGA